MATHVATHTINDRCTSADTPHHDHRLIWGCCLAGAFAAGCALVAYPLLHALGVPAAMSHLVAGIIMAGIIVAATAWIATANIAALRRHTDTTAAVGRAHADHLHATQQAQLQQLHQLVCTQRAELATLPDDVRTQVNRQGEAYMALLEQLRQDIDGRLTAVEQRVNDLGGEYERGWVDGAAVTAEAVGQVRQLHPTTPGQRRSR